ncbi:type I restriction-modification enzyme R subunit C-terminal domain-containing protein [Trichocoleus desertorum]|uniref:type I restriction-modification enzyme R subunit C-terminal domain-containing protein n=1 Tax=Trichocoleus desertorum TaxID=1481672 RepID=UPI0032988091
MGACQTSQGLGLFIRSLVELDREAAKQAFGEFLSGSTASADQIEFINLIIDHLTHHGVMEPSLLYESPSQTSVLRVPKKYSAQPKQIR